MGLVPPPPPDIQVSSLKPLASSLVGREPELAQLHSWLDKALRGERQILFVTGEPGIGKTALLDAFRQRLETGGWRLAPSPQASSLKPLALPMSFTHGQCIEQHGAGEAFLPILDAVGRLCRGPQGEQLVDLLRRHAPMWLVQMPAFIEPEELEILQRKVSGASRERMLREFAEALEVLTDVRAGLGPALVLVLEDLHWSDVSTLDLLAFIARCKEPARLLVIGTYRPMEMLSDGHPLKSVTQELYAHGLGVEVSLGVLSEADIAAYLAVQLQVPSPLTGEGKGEGDESAFLQHLSRTLHHRTDGNPLFVVSLVSDLIERNVLVQTATGWKLNDTPHVIDSEIPDSIRHLVARQSERLSHEDQRILEAASIAGMEFSAAAVAAALTVDTARVERQCEQLAQRQQFLIRLGVEEWPDGTLAARYGFLHALYQQLWHERVTPTQLQHHHLQIGQRKERAYGERTQEIAAELAVHFEQGRDYQRAVQYLQRAGQKSQQTYANREALVHYNRALAICERLGVAIEPATPMTIYAGKGAMHFILSEYSSSVEAYQYMLKVARRSGDRGKEVEALYQIGHSFFRAHEFEKALEYAEQAKALALTIGEKNVLAASILVMGLVHEVTGKLKEAVRLWEESLNISREAKDKSIEGFSLDLLGLLHNFKGEYDQALQLLAQALTIGHTHNLQYLLLLLFWMRGLAHCGKGEYEPALVSLQEALELSERGGTKERKCRILNTLGWVYGELYNLERAVWYNQEGLDISYTIGEPESIRNAEINLGDDYLLLEDYERAQQYLEKVYRDSQQRGKRGEEWMKWRYLQRCCHSLGELWLAKGDAEKALQFAGECLKLAEPTESRKNIIKGWRLQGQAFCLQGRLTEAEAVLQKALVLAKEIGNPPQLWKTYHALGEVYERQSTAALARLAYANAIVVIEGVANRLQDQELKRVFLSARPVQEIQRRLQNS